MLVRSFSLSSVEEPVPARAERWAFASVILLSFTLAHLTGGDEGGSAVAEVIWGIAYAFALIGIWKERAFAFPLIRRSTPLIAIVAIGVLSTIWSDDSFLTLRRSFGLFGTTAIAFYVVSRYSLKAFLDTLVFTITACAIISAFLIAVIPETGLMQDAYQGAWRGLFWEKNKFGETMGLGVVTVCAMLRDSEGRRRARLWISAVGFTILLIGSRSATPLVALVIAITCLTLMFRFRNRRFGFGTFAVLAVSSVLIVLANLIGVGADDVLGLLGRDTTLTGRSEVWTTAIQFIGEKPILGYGYQVFWAPDGPVMRYLQKDLGWEPVSAHNGFLEIMLDFGVVGLFLILIFIFEAFRRSLSLFRYRSDRTSAWPLLAVLMLTIMNLADATFALYNELLWLTFMIAFLYGTAGERQVIERTAEPSEASGAINPRPRWIYG